jgi:rSAM/selenodomain-associated transferase 2
VRLSVIIPVYNEADYIGATLAALQPLRRAGHEVLLVDGGSDDATLRIALPLVDRLVFSARGRARQMNAGAGVARGEVLLFLHADTRLPPDAGRLVENCLNASQREWGRFDVRLSGGHCLLRVVETLMNWRSRLSGIATGDQAMFVKREVFRNVGGFPDIPLMEDIALSRRLKRRGPPVCVPQRVLTSSRRWERHGMVRTILTMWLLRLAYAVGISPARLARLYYPPV